jgi:hypothetical protein
MRNFKIIAILDNHFAIYEKLLPSNYSKLSHIYLLLPSKKAILFWLWIGINFLFFRIILMRKRYSFKRLALLLDTLKRLGLVISSIARDEDTDPTNLSSVVALQADAPAFYLTKVGRIKDVAKMPSETRVYKYVQGIHF